LILYLYFLLKHVSTYVVLQLMYILRMKAGQPWVIFLNACLSCAIFNSIDSLRFMVKSRGTAHPSGPSYWLGCSCSGSVAEIIDTMKYLNSVCQCKYTRSVGRSCLGRIHQSYYLMKHEIRKCFQLKSFFTGVSDHRKKQQTCCITDHWSWS
jgi:hypothetical protein